MVGVDVGVRSGTTTGPDGVDWTSDAVWNGTRRPVTSAIGLDPAAYASDAFFEIEQRRVFEQAWVCVGTAGEIAAPGRIIARRVGRRSVIITRNGSGDLRGFLNTCRHRGTELIEADCDVKHTIRCPYHRWGYTLDGELRTTPLFDEIPRDDFDPAEYGLVPVRVDSWGALLFACLADTTAPLPEWLGDLPQRMSGYDLDSWPIRSEQDLRIDANWKLISENFQEYYHLTWVHPELARVSRVPDHYRYQGPGMYCGQTTTPVSGDERDGWSTLPSAPGLDESDGVSGRFVAIFPNVLLSVLPNHAWVMRLEPIAPGVTRETCTMLVPDVGATTSDAAIARTLQFWLDVNDEDIDIVQRGQRGLTGGACPPGPLAPRFEEPLHRFHSMLADHMTNDGFAALRTPPGDRPGVDLDRWGTGTNPNPPAVDVRPPGAGSDV
jgi:phenylpropionate dioxygenase-like ring-hydroxylating dioxygenase large terminal subunit